MSDTVRAESVGAYAPALEEVVVKVPSPSSHVLRALLAGGSILSEEFRTLRARLRLIGEERSLQCLGFVSGVPEEGKTTIALGLALSIAAESERRVLILDADLRRRQVDRYLGLKEAPGLAEWLDGSRASLRIQRLSPLGLAVLPAGLSTRVPPHSLGSARMSRLIEGLRGAFDLVLVDCAPLTPVADTTLLQNLVDGFVFVVRARHSPRETLQRALRQLKPGRVVGVVFNDYREILPSYYSFGSRHYGGYL